MSIMYGFILLIAALLGLFLGEKLVVKHNLNKDTYWGGVFYAILFGLIGARLFHVLHNFDYYSNHVQNIFYIWNGGIGVAGALIFGFLACIIYFKHKKQNMWPYLDIAAIVLPLCTFVGRWANYFTYESLGLPYDGLFSVYVPQGFRPVGFEYYSRFHGVFIYESVLSLLLFIFLYKISSKYIGGGVLVSIYSVSYAVIRVLLDMLRVGTWKVYGISVSGILLLSVGVLLFVIVNYKSKKLPTTTKTSTDV